MSKDQKPAKIAFINCRDRDSEAACCIAYLAQYFEVDDTTMAKICNSVKNITAPTIPPCPECSSINVYGVGGFECRDCETAFIAQEYKPPLMTHSKFTEDDIRREGLPVDVFRLIHDLCYHHDGRDVWNYVKRAQEILKSKGDTLFPVKRGYKFKVSWLPDGRNECTVTNVRMETVYFRSRDDRYQMPIETFRLHVENMENK